jgi:hypothetical protein
MSNSSSRYSRLAPLSLKQRFDIAVAAINFFTPLAYKEMCGIIGKTPVVKSIEPFSARDFIHYLNTTNKLPDADRYSYRVGELLAELARKNLLTDVGKRGTFC